MKLPVPFYKQQIPTDCGATVLRMVLDYLGNKNYNYNEIVRLTEPDKKGITLTLGLAKAAAQLGFKTEFYSLVQGINPELWESDFAKTYSDGFEVAKKKFELLSEKAKGYGAIIGEKSFTLDEILGKLAKETIPICILDWSKIDTTIKTSHFHFVPIVGYDKDHVFVHTEYTIQRQPERIVENRPFFAIPRTQFETARKAFGTDEDIVFISNK
ncbi:MAG: peptidase C39 family protein [Candidatus Pacearchaeota archaeon]